MSDSDRHLVSDQDTVPAYERALSAIRFHLSQLPGYEVRQDALVVPYDRITLFDIYRALQTYALGRPYINALGPSPSPNPNPVIHPTEFRPPRFDLNDLIGVFTVVAMGGPMTIPRDPAFLLYCVRFGKAIFRAPFHQLNQRGGLIDTGFQVAAVRTGRILQILTEVPPNPLEDYFEGLEDKVTTTFQYIRDFRKTIIVSISNAHRLSIDFRAELWDFIRFFHVQTAATAVQYRQLATRITALELRERMRQGQRCAHRQIRFVAGLENPLRIIVLQVASIMISCALFALIFRFRFSSDIPMVTPYNAARDVRDLIPISTSSSQPVSTVVYDLPLPPFSRGDGYRIADI